MFWNKILKPMGDDHISNELICSSIRCADVIKFPSEMNCLKACNLRPKQLKIALCMETFLYLSMLMKFEKVTRQMFIIFSYKYGLYKRRSILYVTTTYSQQIIVVSPNLALVQSFTTKTRLELYNYACTFLPKYIYNDALGTVSRYFIKALI